MADYQFYLDYIHHVDDETEKNIRDNEKSLKKDFRRQLKELENQIGELEKLKVNHENDIDTLRSQNTALRKQLNETIANASKYENKAEEYNQKIGKQKKQAKDAEVKYSREIDDLRKSVEAWIQKCSTMVPKEEYDTLKSQYKTDKTNLEKKLKEGKDNAEFVKEYKSRIKELDNELEHLRESYAEVVPKSDFETLQKLNEENQKQVQANKEEINSLKRELANKQKQYENDYILLSSHERELEKIKSAARKELADKQKQYDNDYILLSTHERELEKIKSAAKKDLDTLRSQHAKEFTGFESKAIDYEAYALETIKELKAEINEKEKIIYDMKHRGFMEKLKDLFN